MLHLSMSLRALVFIVLLGIVVSTGSDVAHSAPSALSDLPVDGNIVFSGPGVDGARDIRTTDNDGGLRFYSGNGPLTNPPDGAAIQFFGNDRGTFNGQAFIDSGAHTNAAIIFRTAPTSQAVDERMRVTATGNVGIGTTNPTQGKLQVDGGIGTAVYVTSSSNVGLVANGGGKGVDGFSGIGVYGSTTSGWAAYFDGVVKFNSGQVQDSAGTCLHNCPSDARLKQDIVALNPVLGSLAALQPVRFRYRAEEFPERHFSTEPTMGLIAQDVETVLPELVTEDDKGYKGVRYEQLPVLLLEGVKELKAENDALREELAVQQATHEAEMADLQARLAAIEQRLNGGTVPLVAAR